MIRVTGHFVLAEYCPALERLKTLLRSPAGPRVLLKSRQVYSEISLPGMLPPPPSSRRRVRPHLDSPVKAGRSGHLSLHLHTGTGGLRLLTLHLHECPEMG